MSFSSAWMVFRVLKKLFRQFIRRQRCMIHMLRNSFKYINYNDLKKFSSDFKEVYNAPNETAALTDLENMKEKWRKKYPYAISNWENNWKM